jgi:O-antigen/teichoic acid export membrane protein
VKRLRNFGWLSAEEIVRLVLSFAVMMFVARHLGPEQFGALSYLFSVVGLMAPLTVYGLEQIAMRRLVTHPENRDHILGTALVIRASGACVGVVVAIGFVVLAGGPEGVTVELTLIAALLLPCLPSEAFNGYFKATERMAWVAVPRIVVRFANAAAAIWLILVGAGVLGFTALRSVEAFLLALTAVISYRLVTKAFFSLRVDPALIRSMLREGTPLFLSALASVIYMRTDQIMLGQLASAETLGHYSVAVRLSECVFFVPMVAHAAFYAGLVRTNAANPGGLRAELQHYYDIISLSMIGLAVVVAAAATVVLTPLLGADYAPAIPMIWILAASLPFAGLGVARSAMLTIRGWLWTAPLTTMLGATINIGLNFLLIPRWGGIGAACATVFSYWLAAHGSCFLLPWLRPTGRDLTRSLSPLAAAGRIRAKWWARRSASETT